MATKDIILKVGNMAKPQEFTLYPYSGGNTIELQSDKRYIKADLRTGEGKINNKNKNYPNAADLVLNGISIMIPEAVLKDIQAFLWNNKGQDGALKSGSTIVLEWENKELFSKPRK